MKLKNNSRTVYLTVGDSSDVYQFIERHKIEKNFVCLESESKSINCSYFSGGVKFISRYTQSVNETAKEISIMKVKHKMLYEELVIINGYGLNFKSIIEIKKLADSFLYDFVVLFVDGKKFGKREEDLKILDFVKRGKYNFKYEELSNAESKIYKTISNTDDIIENLDNYQKVFAFGDVHGCIEPIKEFEKNNGFNDDELYIFLGDYIDRGIDNVEMFKFVIDNIDKKNFVFIIGNHEKSIFRHYVGQLNNNTFTKLRHKEFLNSGIDDSLIVDTYNKMEMFFVGRFNGKKYFFNHGGLCNIPERAYTETGYVYTNGNKDFKSEVDERFTANQLLRTEEMRWTQFHGHRNKSEPFTFNLDQYSYSLEFKVEFGGHLGVVEIEGDSFSFHYIKNNKY